MRQVIEQNKAGGAQAQGLAPLEMVRTADLAPDARRLTPERRVVSGQDWAAFKEQAAFFIKSGLLPDGVRTMEAALTIMVTGYELGIGPMQALRLISVVQGKPVCAAEMMAALVYRDHGDEALCVEESSNERCTISYKRRGWKERKSYTFTIEDARTAGLAGKATWKSFPSAMLRARCLSAVARMAFPDTISGLYTAEEIAPDGVQVTAQGEVVCDPVAETDPRTQGTTPEAAVDAQIITSRQQLAQRVRELAGDRLETVQQWAYLARTHEMSSEPKRWNDMTQEWLQELLRRIVGRRMYEQIRSAADVDAVHDIMREALDRRERREITMEQYQALDEEADTRCAQLEQVMG
jgi:hypothetical protein